MYPAYFGLTEASFSITPDPQYLYLSKQHLEALAHLLYGTGDNGGFVQLTGEVGTGKTTVCRAFLEQLPEHVDVALLLNPALTGVELLRTICGEFGIKVGVTEASTKVLVGRLNEFLLEAHAKGRRPVLMIDEAQNLKLEVLEQIRLLTNLETAKHKLLQIFLVGQPELRDLLQHKNMRQLSQRITARYHLLPLGRRETRDYIRHRLAVAGVKRELFTPGAVRRIYGVTGGIPRLINILCDRSLLGAFATERKLVNRRIVSRAARELRGQQAPWGRWSRPAGAATVALLLITGAGLLARKHPEWIGDFFPENTENKTRLDSSHREHASVSSAALAEMPPTRVDTRAVTQAEYEAMAGTEGEPAQAEENMADPGEQTVSTEANSTLVEDRMAGTEEDITEVSAQTDGIAEDIVEAKGKTAGMEEQTASPEQPPLVPEVDTLMMDESSAVIQLLELWGITFTDELEREPCKLAEDAGLRCRMGNGNWNRLRFFDRPSLIRLHDDEGGIGFALVTGLDESGVTLKRGQLTARIPTGEIDPYWFGEFLLLWQLPPSEIPLIGPGSSRDVVRWLRQTLARVPGSDLKNLTSGRYDQALMAAVKRFQHERGLKQDGIVGPDTLMHLNTAAELPDIPKLNMSP